MARIDAETLLYRLGITSNYHGYRLLITTLETALQDPDKLIRVNRLFREVAETYGISPTSVRDNIETLIVVSWRKNPNLIQGISGYPLLSRPSVKRFLEISVNHLIRTNQT